MYFYVTNLACNRNSIEWHPGWGQTPHCARQSRVSKVWCQQGNGRAAPPALVPLSHAAAWKKWKNILLIYTEWVKKQTAVIFMCPAWICCSSVTLVYRTCSWRLAPDMAGVLVWVSIFLGTSIPTCTWPSMPGGAVPCIRTYVCAYIY